MARPSPVPPEVCVKRPPGRGDQRLVAALSGECRLPCRRPRSGSLLYRNLPSTPTDYWRPVTASDVDCVGLSDCDGRDCVEKPRAYIAECFDMVNNCRCCPNPDVHDLGSPQLNHPVDQNGALSDWRAMGLRRKTNGERRPRRIREILKRQNDVRSLVINHFPAIGRTTFEAASFEWYTLCVAFKKSPSLAL